MLDGVSGIFLAVLVAEWGSKPFKHVEKIVKEKAGKPGGGGVWTLESALKGCSVPGNQRYKQAAEWIYKRYFGYLFAICLRYLQQREEAEEAVQESFMRVFSHIHTFQGKGDAEMQERLFKGWMARITINVAIDLLRSRRTLVSLDDESVPAYELPIIEHSDNMEVQDILQLLTRLPETQRMVFNLYEVEGYQHDEVAAMLGIPEGTSRTYLMRAKQKLREWYQQGQQVNEYNERKKYR